jgi:hypothetical protein
MPTRFTLPHIDISAYRSSNEYAGQGGRGSPDPRNRAAHGARLLEELGIAFSEADRTRPMDDRLPRPAGSFIEVELRRGDKGDSLEKKRAGLRPAAVKTGDEQQRIVALFVPDSARPILEQILADYTNGPLSDAGRPRQQATVESIERIRQARLETFWTDDPAALPQDPQAWMWWGLWSWCEREAKVDAACATLGLRTAGADSRLYFPELVVIPVHARRADIELLLFATCEIAELRRASDNPVFFTETVRDAQHEWTDELAERITWPGTNVPAVCVLDTGINRGHALIEPALAPADLHAIDAAWDTHDHHPDGHGTAMAGLALHGNLTARLGDASEIVLNHRLESVKLLPPDGFDPHEPHTYGVVTQTAVTLPEIVAPERPRVFCMAVSNQDVSGAIPSGWSGAIDQAAAGVMIGDEENAPRRLFIVSGGNIPAEIDRGRLLPQDDYPIEDPAQAWNALTIGGYTDLDQVADAGYERWSPIVGAGHLSPHSRTSVTWPQSRTPFKPELVLEAGNRAVNPAGTEVLTLDSLSLLTTGSDMTRRPLVPFQATSAATAQAARIAAQLSAAHPDFWPETIRGLMVHSAEWTKPMKHAFEGSGGVRDNYALVRKFGYGVPSFERANASAQNHLALVAQAEIQPFRVQGQRRFNECHYYALPLPRQVLETLGNETVELKITLSYFIEPNPGISANADPQRYQSFGLRFDLQRKRETLEQFKTRVNVAERDDPRAPVNGEADDQRWMLGPQAVSCGSLHCDVWSGPAVELLGRDTLCVKPVNGWWRQRAAAAICNKRTRYALIVTLKTANVEVDLYTPIRTAVDIAAFQPQVVEVGR